MEDIQRLRGEMRTPAPRKWPPFTLEMYSDAASRDEKPTNKPHITIDACEDTEPTDNVRNYRYAEFMRSRSMCNLPPDELRPPSPNRLNVDYPLHKGHSRSETSIYELCKLIKSPPQHRRLLAEYVNEAASNTDCPYPNKHEPTAHTRSLPPIRPSSPGLRQRTSPNGSPFSSPSTSPTTSPSKAKEARFPSTLQPLPDVGRTRISDSLEELNKTAPDTDATCPVKRDDSVSSKMDRQETYTLS